MSEDKVYSAPQAFIENFSFNENVASVFKDMISRSVPGYGLTLEMISVISQRYSQANTYCYDIGSSLGASTLAIAKGAHSNNRIVGIDNSSAMIQRAESIVQASPYENIRYVHASVQDVSFEPCSIVSSNFTLQFIPVEDRPALLKRIADALTDQGVFVLSEKINFANPVHNERHIDLYHDFKRGRGYSELEVSQKRSALENVLIPETLETHTQRLLDAGFRDVMPWFQCFNFCSLIAFK